MRKRPASPQMNWLCVPLAIFSAVALSNVVLTNRPAASGPEPTFALDSARQLSMPVAYWIDSRFTAQEATAIRSAFSAWEEGSRSRVSFVFMGTHDARAGAEDDGQTTVVRSDRPLGDRPGDAVARVTRSYALAKNGASARYSDTDITLDFSGRVAWSTDDAPGTQDLESVVLHEVGHVLGLEHVHDSSQGMYPYIARGAGWRRSPAEGDLEGLVAAYPACRASTKPGGGHTCCSDRCAAKPPLGFLPLRPTYPGNSLPSWSRRRPLVHFPDRSCTLSPIIGSRLPTGSQGLGS